MAKDKNLHILIEDSLYQLWKKEADKRGISVSEFVRRAVTLYIMDSRKKLKDHKN